MYDHPDIWFVETSQGIFQMTGSEIAYLIQTGQIFPDHRLCRPNGFWCEAARTYEFGGLFPPIPPPAFQTLQVPVQPTPQPPIPQPPAKFKTRLEHFNNSVIKPAREFFLKYRGRVKPEMFIACTVLTGVVGVAIMGLTQFSSDLTPNKLFIEVRILETSIVVVGVTLSVLGLVLSYKTRSILHLLCGIILLVAMFSGYQRLKQDLIAAYVPDRHNTVFIPKHRESRMVSSQRTDSGYWQTYEVSEMPATSRVEVTKGFDPQARSGWTLLMIASGMLFGLGLGTSLHNLIGAYSSKGSRNASGLSFR